ncbi:MAG TPA: glycosyl hydrolase-related protein, partial [Trueperaceae bacterium]|nr:glycosyl hydrolase-related protein [Trueperaceae bacterium]
QVLSFHRPAVSPTQTARGPVRAAIRLEYQLHLPQRLADDRRSRHGDVVVPAAVELSLDAGASRMDVSVTCLNTAEDHRLRLLVSSGCHADHVWADGHFHVLKRPVRPPSGKGWYQQPTGTTHQRRFVAVSEEPRGLAVLNRGLCEYEPLASTAGVDIAVTLLRCVGWLSREDLISRPQGAGPSLPTPEAQCLGEHRFDLAIVSFAGPWWESALPLEAERFCSPATVVRASREVTASAFELTPPLTLSAFKAAWRDDTTILRIWNPAPVGVTGRLTLHRPVTEAHRVRLDETRGPALTPPAGHLELQLGPAEVATFAFRFEPEQTSARGSVPAGEEEDVF